MTLSTRCSWLYLLAAVWLVYPPAAEAGSRGVRDGAGLFTKADVVQEVERQIENVRARFGVDVLVETVAAPPAERAAELKQLKADKFFPLWAEERALAAGVDGVYVLICTAPRHVEVWVSESADKTLDKHTRVGVRKTLEHKLPRQGSEALREALTLVEDRLDRVDRDSKSGGWAWVVWLALAIVGAWLLVLFVRRFRSGKTVTPPEVVSTSALAGQSIYHAITEHARPTGDETQPVPVPHAEAPTLPYPPPAQSEGTVHG